MDLTPLVGTYGYLAVFLGTLLEGETLLLVGGFLARRGQLRLELVVLVAVAGSLAGDQLFFWLGRRGGRSFLARRPGWLRRVRRARALVERHRIGLTLGFRFLYGLRTVVPFALGLSSLPAPLFVLLDLAGAALWSVVVAGAGYLLGTALEAVLDDLRRDELLVLGVLMAGGAVLWLLRRRRLSRQARAPEDEDGEEGAGQDTAGADRAPRR